MARSICLDSDRFKNFVLRNYREIFANFEGDMYNNTLIQENLKTWSQNFSLFSVSGNKK